MSYNNYLFLVGEERGAFLAFTFRPPSGLPLSCPSSKTPTGPADVFAFASCS